MLKLKHNKKRNIGLLNEFFAKYIANSYIENNKNNIKKAKNLWQKYVNSHTELNKEFKLFEAIYNSNLKDNSVAYELLKKIKSECCKQSHKKLEKEKTNFIHEINNIVDDGSFFHNSVNDYKLCASIQLLLNSWRNENDKNIVNIASLEEQIIEHMTSKKEDKSLEFLQEDDDIDNLVVNIMNEKFNKKYNKLLNKEQQNLMKHYVFSTNEDNDEHTKYIQNILENIRNKATSLLQQEVGAVKSKQFKEKLESIYPLFEQYKAEEINDETVTFYMGVSKLNEELETK